MISLRKDTSDASFAATIRVMALLSSARRALQTFGLDVSRFPACHPLWPVVVALRHYDVRRIVDVGANTGGYAGNLRRLGYRGAIVSFEPIRDAYLEAKRRAAASFDWEVLPYALGSEDAEVTINVAGNRAASSSVLAMLPRHERAAPQSRFIAQEIVRQRRLDDVWPAAGGVDTPAFLKIDVQGYERNVLEGAEKVLDEGLVVGLQLELSYIQLYEGAWLQNEAIDWAHDRGFTLHRLVPGFTDPTDGRMLQADGVFFPAASRA